MSSPTEWRITEAGETVTGPIRLLDWNNQLEVNYVRKAWWRSMNMKPPESLMRPMSVVCGPEDYWRGGIEARDALLLSCEVRVAASPGGHTVLGWACVKPERSTIVYVFVKEQYRGYGLAKQLVSDFVGREAFYGFRTYMLGAIRLPESWRYSLWRVMLCLPKESA